MRRFFEGFLSDESGATSIEYGLICVFIALAIISGASGIGNALMNIFNNVSNGFA